MARFSFVALLGAVIALGFVGSPLVSAQDTIPSGSPNGAAQNSSQPIVPLASEVIGSQAPTPTDPLAPTIGAPAETLPSPSLRERIDPHWLRRGETAFMQNCTECHDAAKSLETTKTNAEWLATVRRMADKPDASIPKTEIESIAGYLTSNNPPAADPNAFNQLVQSLAFNGTLSPTWRGGNEHLQNGGFFPDVWLGANWNNGSPITGRATACVSCHDDGGGSRIELVDAALRLDTMQAFGWQHPRIKASTEFGRFIVPFGAFAAQSNPGVYRTVSRPLMYNMGQRVRDEDLGDPVLPMPFSDEGASFNLGLPLTSSINLGFDGYVVNGLQGTGDGINFDMSRSYSSINSRPSVGGRATLGNDFFKLGASAIGGTFTSPGGGGPSVDHMGYRIYGVDAAFRYLDLFRLQFEYARRDSDHLRGDPLSPLNAPDVVDGCYVESEVLLLDYLRTSLLFRYDWQRQGARIPKGSGITFDSFDVHRLTYGLNFTLYGGSLLMFNYENWILPSTYENLNVFGVRWAATF